MVGLSPPWSGLSWFAPRLPPRVAEVAPRGAPAMLEELGPSPLRAAVLAVRPEAGRWLVADQPTWPTALVGLPGGPVALSLEGNVELLRAPAVALVGTRHPTGTGRALARAYAAAVAEAGGVVVSGLAAGIDTEAHLGARGRTIAVLGQGLAVPMSAWQAEVRRRVLTEGGLVVSEFPPNLPADRWTFPRRNRVIAGLAAAVVVVEAGHRSGAKITAHLGAEYGREVVVVPGLPTLPSFAGCLDLLEEGAGIVRSAESVVSLLAAG